MFARSTACAVALNSVLFLAAAEAANLTTSTQTIDFTGFTAAGFAPAPAAGQLDSDDWRVTGMSDGSGTFGGTHTTGDFARGVSAGNVTTGGIYAFDVSNGGPVNRALGVQPIASDFNPGTMELRLTNTTGGNLLGVTLAYNALYIDNEARSNSFNFEFLKSGVTNSVAALNLTSPVGPTGSPTWVSNARTANLVFTTPLAPGQSVDLIWRGADVGGASSRDEFALDDVSYAGRTSLGTVLASDNFDGASTFASRTISPDLSGSSPPGRFPGAADDNFGILDRTVHSSFNSAVPAGKTDRFFGVQDLTNPDNAGGTGTATWTLNIAGASDLVLAADVWANVGDFETTDTFSFSYSIDGGAFQTALASSVNNALEPAQDLSFNGILIDASAFTTYYAPIVGIGSLLTVRFSATQDAAGELFGFDNLRVLGTPAATAAVPESASGTLWLIFGVMGIAFAVRRRERRMRVAK